MKWHVCLLFWLRGGRYATHTLLIQARLIQKKVEVEKGSNQKVAGVIKGNAKNMKSGDLRNIALKVRT